MFHQADIEENKLIPETTFNAIAESKPTFSIIIPAFNEEHRILKTLLEWTKFLDARFSKDYEILVVMDGCTDRTPSIVSNFAKKADSVVPLIYFKRLGKGGALRRAFEKARGDFIFFTDADASLPVSEFLKFVEALEVGDLVIGCRYWEGSTFEVSLPFYRLVLSRVFNVVLRIVFNELRGIHDTQCGAKAVRRSVFLAIKDDLFVSDFAFDVNLIYSALRKGFTVVNIYVNWNHSDDGSKISGNCWKIGFAMFLSVLRLKVYYSRFRKLLYSRLLKGLFKRLFKVFS
ncbi:MAG: glycosyltransferase [Candidatus Bathyarchaeia archaeon]